MNKFYQLYKSTKDLHERFGTKQTLQQAFDIFTEEYLEALEHESTENLLEEITDMIVTSFNVWETLLQENQESNQAFTVYFAMAKMITEVAALAKRLNIKPEKLYLYFDKVIGKNNAKTHETHYLNPVTGKIQRKSNLN